MNFKIPELLAPVGKTENLYAAIEGGADSVYLGFKSFNARGKASNFNISDLYAIRKILTKHNKKFFLVLNTIIKESELNQLYSFLQIVNDFKPDGLIIQDVGLYNLIKQKTNIVKSKIELHASTQMSTFNYASVKALQELGFKRVVVDRHLTLDEITNIKNKIPEMEIEMFIHGAMCYSLSGSCYFSSYLGGLSANRGLCAQVCRRNFNFNDKTGYLFSLSDLNTLEIMDKIVASKVDALKIEGRMKSPEFVYHTTRAYRHILDNIQNFDTALQEAKEIMKYSISRRETTGFFIDKSPKDITAPFESGVYGDIIGNVLSQNGKFVKVKLTKELPQNSRVRVHSHHKDTTATVKLKEFKVNGKVVSEGKIGDLIEFELSSDERFEKNDLFYLLEVLADKKFPSKLRPSVQPKKINLKEYKTTPLSKDNTKKEDCFYIKLNNFKHIPSFTTIKNKKIILTLSNNNLENLKKYNYKECYFSIPSVFFENDYDEIEKRVKFLKDNNVKKFEITSIGAFHLVSDVKNGDFISADYVNVINNEAVDFFNNMGVSKSVLSHEISQDELRLIAKTKKNDNIVVPIYSKIRLFISRAPHPVLKTEENIYSLRGEKFLFKQNKDISLTFSDKDFSLTKRLAKIKEMGFYQFYVDLEHCEMTKAFVDTLLKGISSESEIKNTSTFNFFLELK